MKLRHIENPNVTAEGHCNGVPYTTDTYNADGCYIHFWFGDGIGIEAGQRLDTLSKAMNARDIVVCTWSYGEPSGFWAHQDIE